MDDCLFCRIARHELDASIVYEDDEVIAFDDLAPQAPVHTLVVPKHHYESIIDDVPGDTLAAMAHAIREVAERKGLAGGFRVIANTGPDAGQTVRHLHMHVLGGKVFDEGLV